jgi:hypothetical protein
LFSSRASRRGPRRGRWGTPGRRRPDARPTESVKRCRYGGEPDACDGHRAGGQEDGRLELIATSLDKDGCPDAVWHAWQTSASGDWTGWHRFGRPGEPASYMPPTIARNGDGCLEVVLITDRAVVWHRRQTAPNDGWSRWQSLGPPAGHEVGNLGVLALAVNAAACLEAFAVVKDRMWHAFQRPGLAWSAWSPMGKPGSDIPGDPVVAMNADGRLELFTLGNSVGPTGDTNAHVIWHRWQRASGRWSGWSSVGAPAADVPPGESRVFINSMGCLELFTLAGDGAVWHRRQRIPGGDWSDWVLARQQGGRVHRRTPGGWRNRRRRLAPGRYDRQRHRRVAAPAKGRRPLVPVVADCHAATEITQTPTLVSNADARLELFVRTVGTEKLYQLSQTSKGSWSPGRQWPPP